MSQERQPSLHAQTPRPLLPTDSYLIVPPSFKTIMGKSGCTCFELMGAKADSSAIHGGRDGQE